MIVGNIKKYYAAAAFFKLRFYVILNIFVLFRLAFVARRNKAQILSVSGGVVILVAEALTAVGCFPHKISECVFICTHSPAQISHFNSKFIEQLGKLRYMSEYIINISVTERFCIKIVAYAFALLEIAYQALARNQPLIRHNIPRTDLNTSVLNLRSKLTTVFGHNIEVILRNYRLSVKNKVFYILF